MPAAAVIPAPIAYIKVVAVKTFVVELVFHTGSTIARSLVRCFVFSYASLMCMKNVCKRIIGVFTSSEAFT